jgi:serine/threonine protein kinase/Tfp pilus assembly protein PilF
MKCPKCQTENTADTQFCKKCAASLKSVGDTFISKTKTIISPTTERRTVAGKYRIIEKLGEGGMGVVFKAEDQRLKRTVALKFMPLELTKDHEAKERFIREAQAAAALSHPNICTIHEIDEEEGKSFIVMEYVEGMSLREKITEGPLGIPETLNIAIQAAQGLNEAHKKGIIHRDIKSANIMLTAEGQSKIMDFGLAKVTGASMITKEAKTMGTVAYMSPEQTQGEAVDHRTDIWSLGVVLYELLTGRLPFKGEHEQALIYSILNKDARPMVSPRSEVPKELEHVVAKVLQKNPNERYQHVGALLDDLHAIAKGLEPFRLKEITKRILKARKSYLFPAAAVFIIFLAVAGLVLFTGRSEAIDSIAVLPMENLSGNSDQEYFSDGMTEELITYLGKIGALRVISRQSVMQYKASEKLLPEIAQELNVDAVVEGTVAQFEEKVRITARLVEATTDRQLWADSYERNLQVVPALWSEVAQTIAREIEVALTPEEEQRIMKTQTVNPEAYDAFLKGRYFRAKETPEGLKKALVYLNQAIEIDPTYAPAYAGLAEAYSVLPSFGLLLPKDVDAKAEDAAKKALELDDTIAEAHTILAYQKFTYYWDWAGAEKAFKRALELFPANEVTRRRYALYLSRVGRHEEALTEMKRAIELDPISITQNTTSLGKLFYYARRYDQAIEQFRKTIDLDPMTSVAQIYLAASYVQTSKFEDALEASRKAGIYASIGICVTHAAAGRKEEAQRMIAELISEWGARIPTFVAWAYASLGEKDKAFDWLEKGYDQHDFFIHHLKVEPSFDPLRSDPRFQDLLHRMKFPE